MNITSEDDLLVYVGKKEGHYPNEVYPKVKIISRTIEVSPDIDLLNIAQVTERIGVKTKTSKATIGYEVKLLKYRKDWRHFNYSQIYSGIGQTLLYLNYGIEKAYLVVGFETDSVPRPALDRLMNKLGEVKNLLVATNLTNWLGLRIVRLFKGTVNDDRHLVEYSTIRYHVSKPNFRFRQQCLINKEFSWNKKLYKRIYP